MGCALYPPSLNSFAVTRLSWVSSDGPMVAQFQAWVMVAGLSPTFRSDGHKTVTSCKWQSFKPEWWSQDYPLLSGVMFTRLSRVATDMGSDIALDGRFPQHYLASERKWYWKTFVTSTMHSEIGHLLCDAYHTHEVLLSSRHLLALAWGTTGESATMETLSWKRWFNHFWSTL